MLSTLIGTFDGPSAVVMVAFAGGFAALGIVTLLRKRSADYQIEAKKLEFDHQERMGTIVQNGEIAKAKFSQNLITSHSRGEEG